MQDRYRRGGARYQYVLVVRKAVPDFFPAVIHHQNPGPGGLTVRKGGASYLDLVIHTMGGFSGPVTITAEGLPKGLHFAPTTISDTRGVLVFWADRDAPNSVGPIALRATAKRGDETITRDVRPYTRVWNTADPASSRPTRELVIAVAETAPFAVSPTQDKVTVEAGKKVEVIVKCERLWPDFKGNVTVIPLYLPGSVKMGTVTISEGKSEATIVLETPANLRPGDYTLAFTAQGQVPFAAKEKAGGKPNTLVPVPTRPITLVVLPAAKK